MVRILIVEDDLVIATDLKLTLSKAGYEITDVLSSANALLEALEKAIPDLILLDVNLEGDMDGIELAEKLNRSFGIPFIFLTALQDPKTLERAKVTAPEAFLVKPVNKADLIRAIEIAVFKIQKKQNPILASDKKEAQEDEKGFMLRQNLFIKVKNRLEKLDLNSVLWIEAKDIYSLIKTDKKQFIVSHPLKELEGIFPSDQFLRIHRSYIISLDKIEALEDNNILIANQYIPIGKTYKEILLKTFRIL